MRTESSYPTPIHGVSTLAPRNRVNGQAGVQENFRSDPVNKLTRRPSMTWEQLLINGGLAGFVNHSYVRNGIEYRIIIDDDGTVWCWRDNVLINTPSIGELGLYVTEASNLSLKTVNDTTFVADRTVVIEKGTDIDDDPANWIVHVNVKSGMNFKDEVAVTVDGVRYAYNTNAYDGTGTDHYKFVGTSYVASQLRNLVEANPNLTTQQEGSSFSIWRTDQSGWPVVKVEDGDGGGILEVIGQVVESTDGFPLYAMPNTVVTVRPDPTTDNGTYYLKAEPVDSNASPSVMTEVVWAETRSPLEAYALDEATMPRAITWDGAAFTIGIPPLGWDERKAGDDDSVPFPDFVGKTIRDVSYFQNRLVFLSQDEVKMTETDNIYNWFKGSAVNLLVTDPIGVAVSTADADVLDHLTAHNRDLLVIAANQQFKISGSAAITPETSAMGVTLAVDCQTDVPPVSIGNSVFIPISYGDSTGIVEYTGQRDTNQDIATPITHHVLGYMPGRIKTLAASSNLEMLVCQTTGTAANEFFVYEQYTQNSERMQQSWCKWILSDTSEIMDMDFVDDVLTLVVYELGHIVRKQIKMYSRIATGTDEVYLDDLLTLTVSGGQVTLPARYKFHEDSVVIRGEGSVYPLFKAQFTEDAGTITFTGKQIPPDNAKVYVGRPYKSRYRPTRPFVRDERGIAVTSDRIRINRFILSVVDTHEVNMHVDTPYYEYDDQRFAARLVGRIDNIIGEQAFHTGDVKFSFSQDADLAEAEFYTDHWLAATIAGIAWEGQYFKTSQRL